MQNFHATTTYPARRLPEGGFWSTKSLGGEGLAVLEKPTSQLRKWLLLIASIALLAVILHISRSSNPYLSDIVEPVTMVEGFRWDCGSIDLVFQDAHGQLKQVSLIYEDDFKHPVQKHLLFGTTLMHGGRSKGTRVPNGGRDESAFINLLERWYARNPAAQKWNREMEASRASRTFFDVNGRPPKDRAQILAVLMLRGLRKQP